ncbi:MAG: MarR family winged helix-turn-helix transcriptional regulator [Roseburia sp.]
MEINKTIGHKLRIINKEIKNQMEEKSQRNHDDLTAMQHWVLGFLHDHQDHEIFQKDMEEAFSISRATASNILGLMEKKGLIQRVSVERDARLKKILLTDLAKHRMEQAEQDMQEMEAMLVKGMTKEDVEVFCHYLDIIAENLDIDLSGENPRCCGQERKTPHDKIDE